MYSIGKCFAFTGMSLQEGSQTHVTAQPVQPSLQFTLLLLSVPCVRLNV